MPELPDLTIYREALEARLLGQPLERARIASPFLLRTFDPPIAALEGRRVREVRRLGKRLVLGFEDDLYLALHLMIAGRLRWKERGAPVPGRIGLAALDFPSGTLLLVEVSPKKRASLHVLRGAAALAALDAGGLEPLAASPEELAAALQRENHTLKRALTDPRIVAGIGNAYSDEILHRARLSPVRLTRQLDDAELARLQRATVEVLEEWTDRLRREAGGAFPAKVTAFRPRMAAHGRAGKPCPACGDPIQRIVRAENEANYCATCQTGGRLLRDRALSRLLGRDWPATIQEMEERRSAARGAIRAPGTKRRRFRA